MGAADSELVEALRRGDRDAYASLVDELSPALLRLAMAHVPGRAVAEEVVQDTWMAVIKGIEGFAGRSALRTWIFGILLNLARTRGKRERRTLPISYFQRRAEEGGGPAVDPDRFHGGAGEMRGAWASPPAEWQEPERKLATADARRVMLEAIAGLPPRQRDVIVLRDVQGYSAEAARNALEISETNQRVLLHRARSRVRAALEEKLDGATLST